jgi:L-aminopeptidase/D-esterase-like protein
MIPGLRVGHATDEVGLTGCTVILSDAPAVGGVEIRGWAAGVHGLEFLDPRHLVPTLDGVVLAGGSAFGLEAIWGVMRYLEERGVGFPTSQTVVPHVAGAILYDLGLGDPTARPDRAMGHRAAAAARPGPVAEGNVGAGTGASVGKLHGIARATKGGLGCVVLERDGVHLGALMAVNAVGDVRDPETGRLIAGARDAADGRRLIDTGAALAAGARPPAFRPTNTTIGLVATTAGLDKPGAARLARLAMDGFTRALSPPHLNTDGDTLFCLSVGTARADVDALGRDAADLVARAIARAVRAATAAGGLPASRDLE